VFFFEVTAPTAPAGPAVPPGGFPPTELTVIGNEPDAGSEFDGEAVRVTVYVPAADAVTVHDWAALCPSSIVDMRLQPDDMLIPVPPTDMLTSLAVVSPLLWTLRFTVKLLPAFTEDAEGVASTDREGGRTMLNCSLACCWRVQPLLTLTEMVWAVAVCVAPTVVQLTEVAPVLMVFCVLSPERVQLLHPEKLMVACEQSPLQPPASTVKVLSFIIS
jgi:hypothetical protein